jgi:hypothetical protein
MDWLEDAWLDDGGVAYGGLERFAFAWIGLLLRLLMGLVLDEWYTGWLFCEAVEAVASARDSFRV